MKKIIIIIFFFIYFTSHSAAKILNLNENITLDVPNSHNYFKFEEDEISSAFYGGMNDFLEVLGDLDIEIDLYLVGPNKIIQIVEQVLQGKKLEDLDFVKKLIKKAEKKNFSSEKSQMKWAVKEIRSLLKKEKINFFTYVMVSKTDFNQIDDGELKEIINTHDQMSQNELKNYTKQYRKQMTSLSRDNKSIPINEDSTIVLNKFEIAKNTNGQLFLNLNAKFDWMNVVKIPFHIYISRTNGYMFAVITECWVNCQKQTQRFNDMIKPLISNVSINSETINKSKQKDKNFVDQLQKLNDLYKSGALTKEEFEKAKKKILN
tara:strand:- start:10 stop:966 length:957 start_codon:yes stop_codon:yes gene_type:complete